MAMPNVRSPSQKVVAEEINSFVNNLKKKGRDPIAQARELKQALQDRGYPDKVIYRFLLAMEAYELDENGDPIIVDGLPKLAGVNLRYLVPEQYSNEHVKGWLGEMGDFIVDKFNFR